jgi:hypothetical protein
MPHPSPPTAPLRPWQRLHAALMPDYNRAAAAYWWIVVLGGGAVLLGSLWSLATQGPGV